MSDPFSKIGQQLDKAREPIKTSTRPPASFTASEYCARYRLKPESARKELIRLIGLGILKRHGIRPAYYTFIEK